MYRDFGRVHGDGGHGLQAGQNQCLVLILRSLETDTFPGDRTLRKTDIRLDHAGNPMGGRVEYGEPLTVPTEGEKGIL